MPPTLTYLPTPEYVASALLSDLLGVGVSMTLPKADQWVTYSGSVRAHTTLAIVGGMGGDTPLRGTVVSASTWATILTSDRPPLGVAAQLAEVIVDACRRDFVKRTYQQSAAFVPATVHSLWFIGEPRRLQDPDASMAHYSIDFGMRWSPDA